MIQLYRLVKLLPLFLCMFLGLSISSSAQQLIIPFAEVIQSADAVFYGKLTQDSSYYNPQRTMIFTDYTFTQVNWILHSERSVQKNQQTVTLTFAGGTVGDTLISVCHMPELKVGKHYLLSALDEGIRYANPLVGGDQGLFEIRKDPISGIDYLFDGNGKGLLSLDVEALTFSRLPISTIENGTITYGSLGVDSTFIAPRAINHATGLQNPVKVRADDKGILPIRLRDFISFISNSASTFPLPERKLRLGDETGYFVFREGDSLRRIPILMPNSHASFQGDTMLYPMPPYKGPEPAEKGDPLGACGAHDLSLVMEQVPSTWWSFSTNNNAMANFNNFMDIYRYTDSDGRIGPSNGENEFCGWMNNTRLQNVFGFSWGSGIAMCVTRANRNCGEIHESDIIWNSAFSWTSDFDVSFRSSPLLLRTVAMHELGHSWGYQIGSYNETYSYDRLSVMHSYYSHMVENGLGIHSTDAYLIRRHYDNQTSIKNHTDIGVESYYASNGLINASTNRTTYQAGDNITIRDITVENMSNRSVNDLRIRFFLSRNKTISTADEQIGGYWYWNNFCAECYNTDDYTVSTAEDLSPGTYYVGAIVTRNGFGSDSYSANNTTFLLNQVTITPGPCRGTQTSTGVVGSYSVGSSSAFYGHNSDCSWIINPSDGEEVVLSFNRFSTESGSDYVYVYDGTSTSSPLLGRYSGSNLPPTITSSGSALRLRFTSDGSVNRSGWAASYFVRYCKDGQTLSNHTGSFGDGSGTYSYAPGTDCNWLIDVEEAKAIAMDFTQFQTESSRDFLRIYDGSNSQAPSLGSFSGTNIAPVIISSGNQMYLEFTSNASSQFAGWQANYSSQYCLGDNTLKAYVGSFSDGSNDKSYGNYSNCSWLIQPDNAIDITLEFEEFNIENGSDFVSIYDGSSSNSALIGRFTGNTIPDAITSSGGSLFITFTSNERRGFPGWKANYNTRTPFLLLQSYPNPGNQRIKIPFTLPEDAEVYLVIFNAIGQKVRDYTLDAQLGYNEFEFNTDVIGSGIYYYQLHYKGEKPVKKMLVRH